MIKTEKLCKTFGEVMTTRLAGGMFSPYKGILPACARKAH